MPAPIRPVLLATLTWLAATTAAAVPVIPPFAEARAERHRIWRERLDEAEAARRAGDPERAAGLYRDVIGAGEHAGDGTLLVARAVDGLADVLRETGRPDEAEPLYRRAALLWERLLGADQPRLAVSLHHLGLVLSALGRDDEARVELHRALTIWDAAGPPGASGAEATRSALRALDARAAASAHGPATGTR